MVPFLSSFPGDSDGGESACKAGDLGSVPGFRTSPGDGNGNLEFHEQWSLADYNP